MCELKLWADEGREKFAVCKWHSQDVELMWKEKISVRFEMKRSFLLNDLIMSVFPCGHPEVAIGYVPNAHETRVF